MPRILLAVAFAVIVAAAGLAAPAPAQAQTGNVVAFGDSYTASPDQFFNAEHNSSVSLEGSSAPAGYPSQGGCLQSPNNWPRQMAAQTGLDVADWSCTAQTSYSVLPRIDSAIQAGDLNAGTQAVFLAVGANDFGPFGIQQGSNPLDIPAMNNAFSANMIAAGDNIRAVAPNAQIFVAGVPEVTNGHGICVIQAIPNAPLGIPVPGELAEDTIRNMQRTGAQAAGMQFIDNHAMTRGHNTCSTNDSQRYVAGIIDFTSPAYTMSLHPTDLGHSALARNHAAALGY